MFVCCYDSDSLKLHIRYSEADQQSVETLVDMTSASLGKFLPEPPPCLFSNAPDLRT